VRKAQCKRGVGMQKEKTRKTQTKTKAKEAQKARHERKGMWLLYAILLLFLLAYAITKQAVFGICFAAIFIIVIILETKQSIKSEGAKKTAIETAEAVAAVVAIWLIAIIVLGTTSPIDVVPSCSMLPTLRVGDLVVLMHISNMQQFLSSHNIPVVNVSESTYSNMLSHINDEFVSFYAYLYGNESKITDILANGEKYNIGLYNTKCLAYYSYIGQQRNFYKCMISNSTQQSNLIKYNYKIGKVQINNKTYSIVETSSIEIGNETIYENYSNPIIVYRTLPNDTFSGDIVHRVFAAIHIENTSEYYLLTKGDNNPALDLQFGNYPVSSDEVVGTVIAKIPWLGYVTLALKGGIDTAGCNQTIQHG